jgi:hypothetical protein
LKKLGAFIRRTQLIKPQNDAVNQMNSYKAKNVENRSDGIRNGLILETQAAEYSLGLLYSFSW